MQAIIDSATVWDNVLGVVEKRLNKNIFDSWFLPIKFEACDDAAQTLILRAGKVTKDWVCSYYSDLIQQSMNEVDLLDYKIDWKIEENESPKEAFEDDEIIFETRAEAAAAAGAGATETVSQLSFIKNNS